MDKRGRIAGLIWASSLLLACPAEDSGTEAGDEGTGETGEGTEGTGETGEGTGEGTGDGDPTWPITISGHLLRMPSGVAIPTTQPVGGGEVCFVPVDGEPQCTTTLTNGGFELTDVPPHTVGAIRFRHESIATFYQLLVTGAVDIDQDISVDTPTTVANYYSQTQTTPGEGGVVVLAEIYPDKRPGYSASLTPTSGTGPYYYSTWYGTLDLEATETSAEISMAVFLDVDRDGGPYEVVFDAGNGACVTAALGEDRPPFSVPADADVVYAQFACP